MRFGFVVVPVVVYLAAACAEGPHSTQDAKLACDVALVHVQNFAASQQGRIAFQRASPPLLPSREVVEKVLKEKPEFRSDPDASMMLLAADVREIDVISKCPNLAEWLQETKALTNQDDIDALTRVEGWTTPIIVMSFPAVSPDGKQVYVQTKEYLRQFNGKDAYTTYVRGAKGKWSVLRRLENDIIS